MENEQRYRSLIDNLPIGIYRTTPDGEILYANPALLKMLGYNSFDELDDFDIEKNGYADGYSRKDFCDKIEAENEIIGLESVWRKKDGSCLFVLENARVIKKRFRKNSIL